MTSVDPTSVTTLGFCLVILAVVVGGVLARLGRSSSGSATRGRNRKSGSREDRGIPIPERRPGEGPLWVDGPEDTSALDEDEPLPAAAELPYDRRRYLLTQAERDFFAVLRAAAPEGWYVFLQVRLANLVMLKKGTRNWKPHYSRVAQKCVDFVLCDGADISPRLVVELDDSSHDRADRQARDAFVDAALRAARLPILHVRWQRRYDTAALTGQIRAAAGLAPALSNVPQTAPPVGAPHLSMASVGSLSAGSSAALPSAPRWACRACNAEVYATSKFCPSCGATLEL